MQQFNVSFTPAGQQEPSWASSVLAKDASEALKLAGIAYSKKHPTDIRSGVFNVEEDMFV